MEGLINNRHKGKISLYNIILLKIFLAYTIYCSLGLNLFRIRLLSDSQKNKKIILQRPKHRESWWSEMNSLILLTTKTTWTDKCNLEDQFQAM